MRHWRAAYVAGIIDGEGYIGLKRETWKEELVVVSVTPVLTDYLLQQYGGATYCYDDADPNHRPQYRWIVTGQKAVDVLTEVRPHLLIKRRQAELAIECRNGYIDLRGKSDDVKSDERNRREKLRLAISNLNQGVTDGS